MRFRRFLVTGAAGFVGASVARRLVDEGAHVAVLLQPRSDTWRLRGIMDRLEVVEGSVLDPAALGSAVAQARPEVVFHLAVHGGYPTQTDAKRIFETNLTGTWNVLAACHESPCELFVHAGSSSEYGLRDEPMRETDRLAPNSHYAVAKAAATHLVSYQATLERFACATLRLFSVYGPLEEPTRLVPTLLRRALRGEPLEMVAPGTGRDFVFIDDVVDAFLRVDRLASLHGDVVNIGSGKQSTVDEVVKIVVALTASKSEVRWGAMERRIWDTRTWVASCERASELLGWRATRSLEDGIARTLAWTRAAGEETHARLVGP